MDFITRFVWSLAVCFSSLAQMYLYRRAFWDPVHLTGEHHTDLQNVPPIPSRVQPYFFLTTHIWNTRQKEMVACYVKWPLLIVGFFFFSPKLY